MEEEEWEEQKDEREEEVAAATLCSGDGLAPLPVSGIFLLAAASRLFAVDGRKRLPTLNWTDGQEVMSQRKRIRLFLVPLTF